MALNIKLTEFQDRYLFSSKRFPAFVGGWGTGKSMTAILRCLRLAQETPKNLGLICRKEYTDLRDSTIKDFERYTGMKVNQQNKEVELPNGSIIMFRHADELATLQNINLGFFFIEQAEELDSAEQWFMLHGRLRRQANERSGFVTANCNGHNWVWELWKDKAHTEEYELVEATTYDNAKNLPEDFIKSLESLPELMKRKYVLNDWSVAEGLVWADFKEDRHVVDSFEVPDAWKEVIALDHGYNHPTAILFGAVDFDGTLYIYDEIYEREKLASAHAAHIKELEPKWKQMKRFIDPSCRNKIMQKNGMMYSIMDEYLEHGIMFNCAQNDWDAGVNRVAEYFKRDKLKIFKDKCPNLIREIKQYKYKPQKPGAEKTDERPLKINDDACDALRYLVMSRPQLPEHEKKIVEMSADWWEKQAEEQERFREDLERIHNG